MNVSIPLLIAVVLLIVSVIIAIVDRAFPAILFAIWAADALYIGSSIKR